MNAKLGDGATLPCHWYENPEQPGERFLVPCCYERLIDADAECVCELPIDELARLRSEVVELASKLKRMTRDFHDLVAAVGGRENSVEIFDQADSFRQQRVTP